MPDCSMAVCSRNVTQMSSMLQILVEETISETPVNLDSDVKAALEVMKKELLGHIRGALMESHCYDQSELQHPIRFCNKREGIEHRQCGTLQGPDPCSVPLPRFKRSRFE